MDESLFCSMPYESNLVNELSCAPLGLKALIGRHREPVDVAFVPRYRVCYECGAIVATGDDYTRHALAHEVTGIALQLYHFEAAEQGRMTEHLRRQEAKQKLRVMTMNDKYLRRHIPNAGVSVDISNEETRQFDATVRWLRADSAHRAYFHPAHVQHVLDAFFRDNKDEVVDVVGGVDDAAPGTAFAAINRSVVHDGHQSTPVRSPNRRRKRVCFSSILSPDDEKKFNDNFDDDVSVAEKSDESETEWLPAYRRRSRPRKLNPNCYNRNNSKGKGCMKAANDALSRPPPLKRHKPCAIELEEKAAVLNLFMHLSSVAEERRDRDGRDAGGEASADLSLFGPLPSQRKSVRLSRAATAKTPPVTKSYFTRSRKSTEVPPPSTRLGSLTGSYLNCGVTPDLTLDCKTNNISNNKISRRRRDLKQAEPPRRQQTV